MSKLIFNPEKDMKELEKYGFSYTIGDDWHKTFKYIYVSRGDNNEFVIIYYFGIIDDEIEEFQEELEQLLLLQYNLIKANLIIDEEELKDEFVD